MDYAPSNSELKKLIEQAMIRFQNWKLEVEKNPNPRMVHSLKNIVSIINNLAEATQHKMKYSYKALCRRMADLIHEVAELNMNIMSGLDDDDMIDEEEEEKIVNSLFLVVRSATDLIRIVQDGFGMKKNILMKVKTPELPEELKKEESLQIKKNPDNRVPF